MTAPDGKIRIPLNEEGGSGGQIEEYLLQYNGEGIQHIAFACDDLSPAGTSSRRAACPS
jgi:4-hydroxyphenylpyruvate dioxygenase